MIEAIAITLDDAINIESSGVERIELVSALSEGGLTPSYGLIKSVCETVKIPVNVMIRPHSSSFVYSNAEIKIMKQDIEMVKSLGANGVVFGVLNNDNQICKTSLEELLKSCDGLEVTFHRAIDELDDPVSGVNILSKYRNITNILTSGGKGLIESNLDIINKMVDCSSHIEILVGGGLNSENISYITSNILTSNFHFGTAIRVNKSLTENVNVDSLVSFANNIKEIIKSKQM